MRITISEYTTKDGKSPFAEWFHKLDSLAAAKVTTALYRLEAGNTSNVKSLGSGIFEYKINFGPGYRLYFGKSGEYVILLLCGGNKKRQQKDIDLSIQRWKDFKDRKQKLN